MPIIDNKNITFESDWNIRGPYQWCMRYQIHLYKFTLPEINVSCQIQAVLIACMKLKLRRYLQRIAGLSYPDLGNCPVSALTIDFYVTLQTSVRLSVGKITWIYVKQTISLDIEHTQNIMKQLYKLYKIFQLCPQDHINEY